MKKQIAAILLNTFILSSLTACSEARLDVQTGNLEPATDSVTSRLENTSTNSKGENSVMDSSNGSRKSNSVEKVTGIYGETEIPDIPCGRIDFEGKASTIEDYDVLEQCLNSMVFETHTFGDYTVRLVGDSVRTDKVNFPNSIYTQSLRVEVEKNGENIHGSGNYSAIVMYVSQFQTEFRLLTDKIGGYLTLYELEEPVIAMRYFFDDNPERTVTKTVDFVTIQNNNLCNGFVGVCAKDTGVIINPELDVNNPNTILVLNQEEGRKCGVSIFAADEFKVIDGKTLVDEKAGIKYTFNFSDLPQQELYTTEKIG